MLSTIPAIAIAFVTALAISFCSYSIHSATLHAQIVKARILQAALGQAQSDAIAAVNAQMGASYNPDAAIATIATTYPACGQAIEGVDVTSSLCQGTTVQETLVWQNTAAPDVPTETLGNVNRSVDMNGQPIEGYASFAVTLTLQGTSTLALRTGTLRIRIADSPPTFASLDGFVDANGDQTGGIAEGGVGARCDPSLPGCSAQAITMPQPAATPDDARIFAVTECQDAAAGTSGHPGDLCNPTGDATPSPEPTNNWINRTVANGDGSTGWSR